MVAPDGNGVGTPWMVVFPPLSLTVADPLAVAPPHAEATEMAPEIEALAFPLMFAFPVMCGLATTCMVQLWQQSVPSSQMRINPVFVFAQLDVTVVLKPLMRVTSGCR